MTCDSARGLESREGKECEKHGERGRGARLGENGDPSRKERQGENHKGSSAKQNLQKLKLRDTWRSGVILGSWRLLKSVLDFNGGIFGGFISSPVVYI